MDQNTISVLSYNSTGMDQTKIAFINDMMNTFKIDIFQIQEHFKATRGVHDYFKKNFPQFDSYVQPAIRENIDNGGRPKGGLGMFVNKECSNLRKERILCKSWRVQAQIIHVNNNYKLLWMNMYFPTDPQLQQIEESELLETLADIENVIMTTSYHDALIGGDWNWDSSRNTRFVRLVEEFLNKHGLVSVWSKFACDFTYQHNTLQSFSTIDHYFVTSDFLENCVTDAAPLHLAENRSGHQPIMIKILLPETANRTKIKPVTEIKPCWRTADEADIALFSETLHNKLAELPLPDSIHCTDVLCQDVSHSHERDSHVIDLLVKIVEATYECLPLKTRVTNGVQKFKSNSLPGYTENILPLKRDSQFWHAIWISADKPIKGGLFNIYKWTRNKYHYAIRLAKREKNRLESEQLGAAAELNDIELYKEMKRHISGKGSGQEMPDELEGKVTPDDIIGKFRQCYSDLYNSADRTQELVAVKSHIQDIIRGNVHVQLKEANKLNAGIVRAAVEMLKAAKGDVSGYFTSDAIINGPQILFDQLSDIFKSFVIHGTVTEEVIACAFLPLWKGGLKNKALFSSYRGIASASQLLKTFEYCVLILWSDKLSTDSMQFGFKRGASTSQCSWLVYEVCQWFNARGATVYAAFMDLRMAFDMCLFNKLFLKILKRGVPAIVVRTFIYAYQEQKGWIRLAGRNSNTFKLSNGTRQGSVLSPAWFGLYINELLRKLRKSKLGCHVAGVWFGACAYADDLCLLAPNSIVLQKMVTMCQKYGEEHNLVFSTDPVPGKKYFIFESDYEIEYCSRS